MVWILTTACVIDILVDCSGAELATLRFDGKVNGEDRYRVRQEFEARDASTPLLLYKKGGGIGLNP